jgi:sarcosine oxidase
MVDGAMAIDVVVVGLGAMGSAAVYALARRGLRVVGVERFEPGHDRGSSHGATRIIRLSYFEHPSYVPLVRRSYALWREIERDAARKLLHVTGIVEAGPPDGVLVKGTLAASRQHDIRHEVLDAPDVMRRFPAFHLPAGDVGVVQPDGGLLEAEPAILTLLQLARAAGAELRSGETVRAVEPRAQGVRVVTDRGTIEAGAAVIAAGPWLKKLLPNIPASLRVTRQVIGWFEPSDGALFEPGRFPVFMIESWHGIHYGFPIYGQPGVKVGRHFHRDETVDPDTSDRAVSAQDEAIIRAGLAAGLPAANGRMLKATTCLYTMTPDGDFIIDRLPDAPQIVVASPCSGHGFKFAPAIGEILADLATKGATGHDIARFSLSRCA